MAAHWQDDDPGERPVSFFSLLMGQARHNFPALVAGAVIGWLLLWLVIAASHAIRRGW